MEKRHGRSSDRVLDDEEGRYRDGDADDVYDAVERGTTTVVQQEGDRSVVQGAEAGVADKGGVAQVGVKPTKDDQDNNLIL